MSRLPVVWLVLAVLFTLANLVFAFMPAVWQEPMHGGLHVALAVLGGYVAWRLERRRRSRRAPQQGAAAHPGTPSALTGRLAELERSVDAVAIEVERIGEGQRFVTRVLTGNDRAQPSSQRVATPPAVDAAPSPPPTAHG
jgi:hypothetical protein